MLIGDKKNLMFHTETLNFCSLTQRSRYYADPTGLTWVPAGQGCHSPSWPACSTYYRLTWVSAEQGCHSPNWPACSTYCRLTWVSAGQGCHSLSWPAGPQWSGRPSCGWPRTGSPVVYSAPFYFVWLGDLKYHHSACSLSERGKIELINQSQNLRSFITSELL